jgi:hypothetical protein
MKTTTIPDITIPKNVMLVEKIAIKDVIAHPNVKVCKKLLCNDVFDNVLPC